SAYFSFMRTVFPGVEFEEWYRRGFWRDTYIPYSVVADGRIVSNVSAAEMKLLVGGREVTGVQIGAVGTIPEFRKRGLSRRLMEHVLEKYCDSADLCFLFANDTVLEFYPRFAFRRCDEVRFLSESTHPKSLCPSRRLNIHDTSDVALVADLLRRRLPITQRFGAVDYDHITWWHILNIYPDNLYYVEEEEVLFIITERAGTLHIHDVIHAAPTNLISVLPEIIPRKELHGVVYEFPPDELRYAYDRTETCSGSPLFIRGHFPLRHGTFKFPVTAQT
ncbi:MAG: GNAT family N-acetyltransferase, partial [Candidatus Thorarchaeota archaeon]